MVSKSVIWLVITLFVVATGAGIFGYIYYTKYQNTNTSLQTSQLLVTQNEKYHAEILKQVQDSIQILSGLVIDLNNEKDKIERKYTIQVTDLKLQIGTLEDKGETISITGKDSDGIYLDIPFSGKVSIASYDGYTRYYFGLNKSFYDIALSFEPIDIFSIFYIDDEGVWKIQTESITPGISLNTDYRIDSTFYSMFKNTNSLIPREEESLFKLKIKAGIVGSWNANDFYRNRPISVSAEFNYDFFYAQYAILHNFIEFGVYYDLTLALSSIKNIFSVLKSRN